MAAVRDALEYPVMKMMAAAVAAFYNGVRGGVGRPWQCFPPLPGVPASPSRRCRWRSTADAPSSSDRPPHGGRIRRHRRDGNDRDDVNVGVNGREVGRRGTDQHRHCRRENDETRPTTTMTAHRPMSVCIKNSIF